MKKKILATALGTFSALVLSASVWTVQYTLVPKADRYVIYAAPGTIVSGASNRLQLVAMSATNSASFTVTNEGPWTVAVKAFNDFTNSPMSDCVETWVQGLDKPKITLLINMIANP